VEPRKISLQRQHITLLPWLGRSFARLEVEPATEKKTDFKSKLDKPTIIQAATAAACGVIASLWHA
jgi:hypothetical protein